VLTAVLFVPLTAIAFLEVTVQRPHTWVHELMVADNDASFDDESEQPETRDPAPGPDGFKICTVPFSELVRVFPDAHEVRRRVFYLLM
jgi:hypothetical protein